MKKIAVLLIFALLLTLAACSEKNEEAKTDAQPENAEPTPVTDNTPTAGEPAPEKAEESAKTEAPSEPEAEPVKEDTRDPYETDVVDWDIPLTTDEMGISGEIVGGWTYESAVGLPLDEELADLFFNATAGMMGASHEALCLLGTQVVAGTNYAFLAKTTLVTAAPVVKLTVVIVTKGLDGTASLRSINDFEPAGYTASETATGLAGGWTVAEQSETLPEDVKATFDEAMNTLLGVSYTPVALLGSQVVAGANYLYLASATTVTAQPVTSLKLVSVYKALDGTCSINAISDFSIADFND